MAKGDGKQLATDLLGGISGLLGGGKKTPVTTTAASGPPDLAAGLAALGSAMPQPDPNDPEGYALDFATWLETYTKTADALSSMEQARLGTVTLADGTVMPIGDLTPQERAVFDQANQAKVANAMQALGIQQAQMVDERRQADFNNQMERIKERTAIDDQRLTKSQAEITRRISGMNEARGRADLIANTKLSASPYATRAGKSSFTGDDLGSLVSEFARFSGVDPGSELLRYQGTANIDPEGDMNRLDKQFGVDGPLPGLAELLSGEGEYAIPDIPGWSDMPSFAYNPGAAGMSFGGGAEEAATGPAGSTPWAAGMSPPLGDIDPVAAILGAAGAAPPPIQTTPGSVSAPSSNFLHPGSWLNGRNVDALPGMPEWMDPGAWGGNQSLIQSAPGAIAGSTKRRIKSNLAKLF